MNDDGSGGERNRAFTALIQDFPLHPPFVLENVVTGDRMTLESLALARIRRQQPAHLLNLNLNAEYYDHQDVFGNRQLLRVHPACGPMKHNDLNVFGVSQMIQARTVRFSSQY
jgi:hypothetical protein